MAPVNTPLTRMQSLLALVYAAVLFSLSFPNYLNSHGFSFLAWISLIPLFYVLDSSSIKQRIQTGLLFGILASCLTFYWLLSWNAVGFFIIISFFMIQIIIFCAGYTFSSRSKLSVIYVPALWVSSEFLRSQLMGGYSWGLGHSQAFIPDFIQAADMIGSYGISLIIVVINYGIYKILKGPYRMYHAAILVAALAYLFGNSYFRLDSLPYQFNVLNVCVVQPNISSSQKSDQTRIFDSLQQHIQLSLTCVKDEPVDLIIWPETAVTDDVIRQPQIRQKIESLTHSLNSYLLTGSALLEGQEDYNSAVLFSPEGEIKGVYHKNKLIPFREQKLIARLPGSAGFRAGHESKVFEVNKKQGKEGRFGVVICNEDGYPELFMKLIDYGAQAVIVLLNDGVFTREFVLRFHEQNSIMRAAEFGIAVYRAANTGITTMISERGETREQLPPNTPGVISTKTIPLSRSDETFNPSYFPMNCLIIAVALFFSRLIYCKLKRTSDNNFG